MSNPPSPPTASMMAFWYAAAASAGLRCVETVCRLGLGPGTCECERERERFVCVCVREREISVCVCHQCVCEQCVCMCMYVYAYVYFLGKFPGHNRTLIRFQIVWRRCSRVGMFEFALHTTEPLIRFISPHKYSLT